MIKITLDSSTAQRQLQDIAGQLRNPRLLFGVLGETLKKIHTERFKQQVDPSGRTWQPLSPLTLSEKRGTKILRERGQLADTLAYNYNDRTLEFGSGLLYAPVHQFGATVRPKKGKMLKTKGEHFLRKAMIPARPWLGVNSQNEQQLLRKANAHLQRQLNQSA
ncbi:phage virion morphogenesis protein [Lonepinella koalarum]|uniref:phage virion morphogenesis protein n=1 Tax=Lonepinella koalarum TaxID=53417 RepID=UPI003F6DB07D